MDVRSLTLHTPRLCLREIVEKDWPFVLQYQSKPEYLRYYPWNHRTPDDVQQFLQMFINWKHQYPRTKFQLAVTLANSGQFIGLCGVRKKSLSRQDAEIGYEIDSAFWGQGYATEAAQTIIDFGFRELQLHRIWATCIPQNKASIRVLTKLGLQYEGRIRENRWMKNRWWDTLIYGMLEDEWKAGKT